MTRDEIIKLAREAGFAHSWSEAAGHALERFAALIAAAEREQCALNAWEIVQYDVHADLADKVAQAILERSNT